MWNDKGQGEATQMTQKQWKFLLEGEEVFRKYTKALGSMGVDVQQAPQEPYPNHQKAPCLPAMLRDRQENTIGKQSFCILLPPYLSAVKEEERRILQEWLGLVDWRESKVRSQTARQHSGMWVYARDAS